MAKRPRSEVQAVIIYKKGKRDGQWVPHKIERNSWVTLNAPKRGPWAKEPDLKAQIRAFKFKPNSTVVESILVAHAYSFRQLQVSPSANGHGKLEGQVNYLYPSKCQDWQDPQSISNVILVVHAEIGELTRGNRSHKQLEEAGVFFYNASYAPSAIRGRFGKLIPIPLPPLDNEDWPVLDMQTSEAFRARLRADFQAAMKPTTGSRVTHLHWFMPLHVMLDLFAFQCESVARRTPQMWVWKQISDDLFSSLMDIQWDSKVVAGQDIIRCQVVHDSVSFRYHIARETLYTKFKYVRHRLVGNDWNPLDQVGNISMINIQIFLLDGTDQTFEVGETWTIGELRDEICFYISSKEATDFFFTMVSSSNGRVKKINRRSEKTMTVKDLGCSVLKLAH